jgi:hypothetical protein
MGFWVSRVTKCRPILTLPDDDCRDFPLRVTHLLISFRFHRHRVTETISATSASPIIPITRLFRGGGISSWTVLPACNEVRMLWSVLLHWITFDYITRFCRLLSTKYRVLRVTDYLPVRMPTYCFIFSHILLLIFYTVSGLQSGHNRGIVFRFPAMARVFSSPKYTHWGLPSHLFSGCHEHFPLR